MVKNKIVDFHFYFFGSSVHQCRKQQTLTVLNFCPVNINCTDKRISPHRNGNIFQNITFFKKPCHIRRHNGGKSHRTNIHQLEQIKLTSLGKISVYIFTITQFQADTLPHTPGPVDIQNTFQLTSGFINFFIQHHKTARQFQIHQKTFLVFWLCFYRNYPQKNA